MKNKILSLLLAFGLCLTLAACGQTQTSAETATASGTAQTTTAGATSLSAAANDTSAKPLSAATAADVTCTIALTGSGATVTGSGAAVSGSTVTITAAGVYRITGTLSEGQIRVECTKNDKVGLLLELVGELYARQQAIPPEHSLTLTVTGLNWRAEIAPPPGCLLRLELYCNLSYPRPLVFHAQVAETISDSGGWQIRTRFQDPSESLQEALERYIFLQHRRAIAHSRRSASRAKPPDGL